MSKYDYNIIVIGGGSAGLVSSYIAAAVKAKVALIEKHKMGGDCLNTGCVPSKALLRSAKMLSYAKRAKEFGFQKTTVEFDFAEVMQRVQNIIKTIAPHDSRERYASLGVECIEGEAKITSPHSVEVGGKTLTARSIIVATGARPLVPPIAGLDKVDYLTSDNVWNLRELPKKLVVLGGGPIGAEMAQAFARLGSEVTIVEMAPQILIREDEEVIKLVTKQFTEEGITVLTSHKAKAFEGNTLICEYEGKDVSIPFDKIIVALGRKANVTGFGLEELGVTISKQGTIEANPFLQTNIPSIYVCGDVTGPYQFTHTAAHQAWYASVNALFSPFKKFKTDYSVIPWATFTDPEVARVGLNEKDAIAQKIPYEVTTYGIDDLDRAIADSEAHGFVKVLTVPRKDKILGVTIVGTHAGDLIAEYILAMKHGIGLNKILGTIHIYPTLAEANKYVAGTWKKAHAPAFTLKLLEKFHSWRR
ncbi:MAG: FAD-dependent oxidoreductase [Rickettsiales bacterium]